MRIKTNVHARSVAVANSQHSMMRQDERSIPDYHLDITLKYGSRHYVPKAVAYYLRQRDVPCWMISEEARKIHGTVVIVSHEGLILTTYQNRNFLKRAKKATRWQ